MIRAVFVSVLMCLGAFGCVYPHRGTALTPVSTVQTEGAPPNVWALTVVDAQVRAQARGGLPWDEDGTLPDVFVRFYRDNHLVYETPTINDNLRPEFSATAPRNVRIPAHAQIRFEIWDRDTVGADPIGIYRHGGVPRSALEGTDARLLLDGGAALTIRLDAPRAHRGVGIDQFEVQPDKLVVQRVLAYSPAGRAGIEPGDEIVGIGDHRFEGISEARAISLLSMAGSERQPIVVLRPNGNERVVSLDRGYVWLTM